MRVGAPTKWAGKQVRAARLRAKLALEPGWAVVGGLALATLAVGSAVVGLVALDKPSDRLIALPAWLAVLTPLWLAYRHRLARPIMRLGGKPRWRARRIGRPIPPLDLDAIIEAEKRKVMAQLPPEEGHDPGQPFERELGKIGPRPTAEERERFERAVDDYAAKLRVFLETQAPWRLAATALWDERVEWRHSGGQVLNNVQVVLSFPTETFRLAQDSGGSLVRTMRGEAPEQPVRPSLELQRGKHGVSYSIETDSVRIGRSESGGRSFELGFGQPQQLDLAATRLSALLERDKIDRSVSHALRVVREAKRLRYDDRVVIEGTLPIEAVRPGFHLVEWEILADELARPIAGRLLVEARPVTESGEPVTDLGARPPGDPAARRLRSERSMRAA